MSSIHCRLLAALALLAGLAAAPGVARAETYQTCAGFIDSVPATITTQGVWCLRRNLSTAITSGAAITIAANNVTIDCNQFKLGGLLAGDASAASGIESDSRQNVTVRHCNVRGFQNGIFINGGVGHLVEDNRLDNNLFVGIRMSSGGNSLVQRNRVYDTGGSIFSTSWGISASADVIDNVVDGVFAATAHPSPTGIAVTGRGSVARGNRVRGLQASGVGVAHGLSVYDEMSTIRGNQLIAPGATSGNGIYAPSTSVCSDNVIGGFSNAIQTCMDGGGNISL